MLKPRNPLGALAAVITLLLGLPAPSPAGPAETVITLDQAVAMAVASHPQLRLARQEVNAARADLLQSGTLPAPDLRIGWDSMPGLLRVGQADESRIGLSQEVEFPTKYRLRREMARSHLRAVEVEEQRRAARLTAQVKRLYLQLLLDDSRTAEQESLRGWFERCGQIAQARYAAQNGIYLDVLRSRIEMARVENELTACRLRGRLHQVELNGLLGLPAEAVWQTSGALDSGPFDISLEQAAGQALARHGGLLQNDLQRAGDRAGLRLARQAALPDFTLSIDRQRLNSQPPFDAHGFQGVSGVDGWALELGVHLPLLAPGRARAERLQAEARIQETAIRREQLERQVRQAVAAIWERARAASEQIRHITEVQQPDTQSALHIALEEYRLNRLSFFELLDFVRAGSEANLTLARARFRLQEARIDLETAGEESGNDQGADDDPIAE